jgi:hypothetical protein
MSWSYTPSHQSPLLYPNTLEIRLG